jgi:hypothetical protein
MSWETVACPLCKFINTHGGVVCEHCSSRMDDDGEKRVISIPKNEKPFNFDDYIRTLPNGTKLKF